MKKIIFGVISLVLAFTLMGCSDKDRQQTDVQEVVGYIFIENDKLMIDTVEIITREDKDRIEELGLIEANDFPSGYYIYNEVADAVTLSLTEDTSYTFTDINQLYHKEDNGDRVYTTKEQSEFLDGSSYQGVPLEEQRIPYFVTFNQEKVIHIIEEFSYTI